MKVKKLKIKIWQLAPNKKEIFDKFYEKILTYDRHFIGHFWKCHRLHCVLVTFFKGIGRIMEYILYVAPS
jgi:hypothetical protein